ncbi:outer membrane beta-barrel protein [Bdellovibrio sp. KM01]|uniref:outer membrane beta-barrel protein n=1 Tax=Bdellovibrio sp. KM01 TaxID=2748865 RepID=UPI0015EA5D2C|nr:outer membrane beta-barrel protein [Bdellovibrio sp. KM01]QLY26591.1 outer membrane beta-barrel protein [Bdellovibrio sp. KM01]
MITRSSRFLRWALAANIVTFSAISYAEEQSEAKAAEPFAFADFTWMNGNNRQKSALLDSKYFTGTFMADTNVVLDFNTPKDHTLVGSTSSGRTNEIQVTQLGIGGDFHHENVRGRIMTQFGMYSSMTPRNDASTARGQWDANTAYRYVSEAYGGYHWDTLNGINLDAGIFMSYIGLFSYYNFENWAYQASYTSANTPWFFNGLRLQVFPTERLKTEVWLINGWQSYGMFNEAPGVGYQVNYRPTGDLSWVFNGYVGSDTLGTPGRTRFHSDNSVQYKYLDTPSKFLSKAAFSVTADIGCESGGGVQCSNGDSTTPSQYFIGVMAYNRLWFASNKYALTLGAGMINNPGRYLVLIPPIQTSQTGASGGASATNPALDSNGNPYFSQNPGDDFRAWDASATFDYMPNEYITFRSEFIHREASVNYFSGPGGVTSPDGLNTSTQPSGWKPDLVNTEDRINLAMMVRF